MQAPLTEIGGLQSDVDSINSEINQMAKPYELSALNSNMDTLERTLRSLSGTLDGFRNELGTLLRE